MNDLLMCIAALLVILALVYDNRHHITHDEWDPEEE